VELDGIKYYVDAYSRQRDFARGGYSDHVVEIGGRLYYIGKDSTRWMTTALPGLPEMIPG